MFLCRHGVDLLDPREQREDPEETKDFLIAKAERNLNRLKIGCENMKIELSLHDEVTKDFGADSRHQNPVPLHGMIATTS